MPTPRNVRPIGDPVRPRDRFLVFGAPAIEEAEIDEVVASMRAAWLGTGPKVARFEEAFAAYKGAPYVAAVNSCTAALHLALLAAGVGPGDEVITSALTFAATVNVIIHVGATPVLADIDPQSMNIDPVDVEARISKRTRAIIPVHFAGRPADMDALMAVADRHSLLVIEDCAHAVEATYRGRPTGTIGDFGCFSFYATKNLTTGEGGMVLAQREEDIARVKVLALHGLSLDAWRRFSDDGYRHYQVIEAGFKYNMMDLQAAIGIHQLERLEQNYLRRQAIWHRYMAELADTGLELPGAFDPADRHALHLFTVLTEPSTTGVERDAFLEAMTAHGIGVGVHYQAIPEHLYYRERFGWRPEDWPAAARIGASTVSLPLSARLSDADVTDVVSAIHQLLGSR
jgi:dTDP-4-amino-4,6-dideoxygalactose transaminase